MIAVRGPTAALGKFSAPDQHSLIPSVDSSPGLKLLPAVLSIVAGSVDTIGLLGLGLFTAHITGNLVVLAARVVSGDPARLAEMLSVPAFVIVLCLTRVLAGGLEAMGVASLRPLLLLQFLLLAGFFWICTAIGARLDPNTTIGIIAAMLGVAAMAVQNALVQVSLKGAPSTAVMTTNITRFTVDIGTILLGQSHRDVATARTRVRHTWPAIVGFAVGCGLGAVCQAAFGLGSAALPAGLALVALGLGFSARAAESGS
jgi:uncharacterized membrane protein YoaK (UPF0700 family)